MIDSGTKHSENRIHLYDPVGLLTDGYGSFRPSSHLVRPRRQALSYDNITENTKNSNTTLGIKSYDHANSTGGLRSYDSFEVDSLGLRSRNESFSSEANGGITSSYDNSNTTTATTTTMMTTMIDQDRSDGSLSFVVVDASDDDDQSDDSTPRLWRPSATANPKPPRSPLELPSSLKPVISSTSHPTSPKSFNSSQLHPTSPTSVNSSVLHPTSPKSANSSLSLPTSPKFANSSPSHPTSPKSVNFSPINPTKSMNSPSPTNPPHHHYQTMSPNSRTQAIANGRKELMEMVRDLPESFYELSLKDIVDKNPETEMKKEIDVKSEEKKSMKESTMGKETKKQKKKKNNSKKVNKSESKKKMVRSKSVDNGKFLLKTSVFPILGSRKNKKSLTSTSSFKVAPMPKAETSSGNVKAGEKDWWRRKSCISSESEVSNGLSSHSTSSRSSTCSSRSNSGNGRRSNRFLPNCCLFNARMIRGKK